MEPQFRTTVPLPPAKWVRPPAAAKALRENMDYIRRLAARIKAHQERA